MVLLLGELQAVILIFSIMPRMSFWISPYQIVITRKESFPGRFSRIWADTEEAIDVAQPDALLGGEPAVVCI